MANPLIGTSSALFKRMMAPAAIAPAAYMSQESEAAPMGSLSKAKGILTRKAHHGSPHDFDEFSMEKIGTGEGNQAFGHGMYFSSSEDLAEGYMKRLSADHPPKRRLTTPKREHEFDLELGTYEPEKFDTLVADVEKDLVDAGVLSAGDPDAKYAIESVLIESDYIDDARWAEDFYPGGATGDPEMDALAEKTNKIWGALKGEYIDHKGKLYDVEIPDETNMLDWDAPLSEQPEKVREALKPVLDDLNRVTPEDEALLESLNLPADYAAGYEPPDPTGEALYNMLYSAAAGDSPGTASRRLREAGIPGISYKAVGGTGGKSGETRNFVVFDDKLTNVIDKRLIAPGILGGELVREDDAAEKLGQLNQWTQQQVQQRHQPGPHAGGVNYQPRFQPPQAGLESILSGQMSGKDAAVAAGEILDPTGLLFPEPAY